MAIRDHARHQTFEPFTTQARHDADEYRPNAGPPVPIDLCLESEPCGFPELHEPEVRCRSAFEPSCFEPRCMALELQMT